MSVSDSYSVSIPILENAAKKESGLELSSTRTGRRQKAWLGAGHGRWREEGALNLHVDTSLGVDCFWNLLKRVQQSRLLWGSPLGWGGAQGADDPCR